ncbi:MAG: hypothetical protein QNJ40_16640 [Xanthomonadales bacterium]|nr:hypothetical protein [Xanthomonadales bacterium]
MKRYFTLMAGITLLLLSAPFRAEAFFGLSIVSRANCGIMMPDLIPGFLPDYVFNESITWSPQVWRNWKLWVYSYHFENVSRGADQHPNHFMIHDGTYHDSEPTWPHGHEWAFDWRAYAGDIWGASPGIIGNGDRPHFPGTVDRVNGDHYNFAIRANQEVYLGPTTATNCKIFDW